MKRKRVPVPESQQQTETEGPAPSSAAAVILPLQTVWGISNRYLDKTTPMLVTHPTLLNSYDISELRVRLRTTFAYLGAVNIDKINDYFYSLNFTDPKKAELAKEVYEQWLVERLTEKLTGRRIEKQWIGLGVIPDEDTDK